jgi:Spy/CpxP family protein refolding chaperone
MGEGEDAMRNRLMLVAAAGLFTTSLLAHPGDRTRRDCVDLSAEQKNAVHQIRERERPALRALHDRIGAAALEYRRLADAGDAGAGRALERVRDLRDQMGARRAALRAEVGGVLSAEQREQMEQCRKERRERRRR